jgi:hypothetical protein
VQRTRTPRGMGFTAGKNRLRGLSDVSALVRLKRVGLDRGRLDGLPPLVRPGDEEKDTEGPKTARDLSLALGARCRELPGCTVPG